jgi:hypothetical protein
MPVTITIAVIFLFGLILVAFMAHTDDNDENMDTQ